jgi:hypothetical protein
MGDVDGGLNFTSVPEYGAPIQFFHVKMLAPDEEWSVDYAYLGPKAYTPDQQSAITKGDIFIFFKGILIYRDVINPEIDHETKFCYTYLTRIDDFHTSGPPQFTDYT